jgi:hypothetical protein
MTEDSRVAETSDFDITTMSSEKTEVVLGRGEMNLGERNGRRKIVIK